MLPQFIYRFQWNGLDAADINDVADDPAQSPTTDNAEESTADAEKGGKGLTFNLVFNFWLVKK